MRGISGAYRGELLVGLGMDPDECSDDLMRKETLGFMSKVSRRLGEKHSGDPRAAAALQDWVMYVEDYDAFDALLTNFDFDNRERVVERGRMLFSSALTGHWDAL